VSLFWRIFGALKYTTFAIICAVLIIALALILRFGDSSFEDKTQWIKNLVDAENFGDRAIGFIVGCLALLGLIPWFFYTSYGLAALPVSLMKRRKQYTQDISNARAEMEEISEKIRNIQKPYELSQKPLSRSDRKDMNMLKAKQRYLRRRTQNLETNSQTWISKIDPFMYPLRLVLGLVLLAVILFLMVSLILSQIDRSIHSQCGFLCGFIQNESKIFNPFDQLLTHASKIFPVDYIIFTLFILLILIAAITGLANIGINCCCIRLYKIRFRSTMPQGLLTGCMFLMFVVVVFSFSMISFAPQYTTFGSQTFMNGNHEILPCNYDALANGTHPRNSTDPVNGTVYWPSLPSDGYYFLGNGSSNGTVVIGRACYMSQLATLVNRIALRAPFFSVVFYLANWIFVVVFAVSFIVALIRQPATFERELVYASDEEDDETTTSAPLTSSYRRTSDRPR
jgi:LMBR1 domain-containing protein 1